MGGKLKFKRLVVNVNEQEQGLICVKKILSRGKKMKLDNNILNPILAREQRLVRDNRAADWRPIDETRKPALYNRLDPVLYAAVKVRYPLVSDLGAIPLRSLQALVVAVYQAWAQSDDGAAVLEKQALGTDGRPSALVTSSEYAVLLDEIAALKALVQGSRAGAGQRQQQQQQQRGVPGDCG
ncbi:hypothetical protein CYMTET_9178 [Cymbomonas tetramitiformis]|uniref:Uncharacterized protein n=1 Tax=Cymbomonas tetramitiformis TaxID=36881 RepID=A0AAE0LFR6_9CHLO|nr:hypothetical protein CYMTET_9178 [Cymbomonas tetramitiformis]